MTDFQVSETDLLAILEAVTPDLGSSAHAAVNRAHPVFTWDYEPTRSDLMTLYETAVGAQWDARSLPWDTDVDQERMALAEAALMGGFAGGADFSGTPFASWGDRQWIELSVQTQNWMLSQFLHGEQGALLCTAKLAEAVPWIEAKYFAATQALDEARHVQVFTRYLDTKLSGHYPINAHLRALLDDILADARWDMTYLGMQVMVEGLSLAAFGLIRQVALGVGEQLLAELLRRVMADEARHVAFGTSSLAEVYDGLSQPEIRERQEFAYEATMRMRDRFLAQEVWERMGIPVEQAVELIVRSPERQVFQRMLFAKVVPNCSSLGLLDAGDGWLRRRFGELGLLAFEHGDDGSEEL